VLAYEALKLLGTSLLPLLVHLDCVVVAHDLIDRFPECLHHFGDRVRLALQLDLLVFQLPLFFYDALGKFFPAHSGTLFCVVHLFLVLAIEVLIHPLHLLEEELMVGPTGALGFLRYLGRGGRQSFALKAERIVGADRFEILDGLVILFAQLNNLQSLTLTFDNKLIETQTSLIRAFCVALAGVQGSGLEHEVRLGVFIVVKDAFGALKLLFEHFEINRSVVRYCIYFGFRVNHLLERGGN
jgi:hypothetical protein